MYAAQGILLALYKRAQTGSGDVVDIAMLDSMVSLLTYQAGNYFATGTPPARAGNRHPNIVPYESFAGADGWFNLAVGNDRLWQKFCAVIGRPDLAADPRFASNPDRVVHRDALAALLAEVFCAETVAHWVDLLDGAGIPCGPILDVGEILSHPQTKAREMVGSVEGIQMTGTPVKLTGAPAVEPTRSPRLGADTAQVLSEVLGYGDAEVASLVAGGVVGLCPSEP
jgi:crotonobetainyl-CoA:carnitine CoA-transferase CaiB-like acyl-CoA transferase